jgi:class 3 adenylate cyclase/CHASE2 domain-containing sensor protein
LCCSGFFVYLTDVRLSFLKSPTFFIAAPVILIVCLLEISHFPYLNRLEWMTFDLRVRLAHHFPGATSDSAANIGLVEITDKTIYEVKYDAHLGFDYGLYWPRDVYAAALKELTLEGARAVAFDVLFAELRDDQALKALPDGSIQAPDDIFAAQLKESGNVVLAADKDVMPHSKFRTNTWRVANIAVDRDADGVLRRDRAFRDYRVWDPAINQAAAAKTWDLPKTIEDRKKHKITFVSGLNGETWTYPTDDEGRIPSTNYLIDVPTGYPDKIVPYQTFRAWSMGIILAAHELNLDLDHPSFEPGRIILHGSNNVTRAIPVDDENYFYIDWSLAQNDPQVPAMPFELLLQALVERKPGHPATEYWKGKMAIIGSQATGNDLADVGATPLSEATFLVTKHLNVAHSVMSGRFVRPTHLSLNLALIVMVGILSAWLTWVVDRPFNGTLLMLAFASLFIALSAWLYVQWRFWVPIFLPMVCAGFVTHVGALVYRVRFEQSQKKLIKQHFSRVLSPDVVNQVLQKATIETAGQRLEITVFFADVRGFTEMTDSTQARADAYVKEHRLSGAEADAYFDAQAKDTLDTVSTYLGLLADIIKTHQGTLDKYIGDCVMAFWGAPLPDPHHALDAVRAAIQAQRAIAELNLERLKKNKQREEENPNRARNGMPRLPMLPVLSMGTGINTGVAIVGFMGSETHQVNYTAFGREVNLASRLEGVSGHGRIIIGEATFAALKRDDPQLAGMCLDWGLRKVKGFREPVRIYEVRWQPETGLPQQPGEDTDIRFTNPAEH